jgi:ABC-type amino acid transport substrate-binding protein
MREKNALDDDGDIMIDIMVPIAYSFPNIGKFTVMFFVMFGGWFTGRPIALADYPSFAIGGVLSLFGSVYVAIPFMLDLVHLPADVFQLFVMSGFITGKFSSMVSVANLFALTLLSVALFQGVLKTGPQHWIRLAVGVAAGVIVVVGVTRMGLGGFVESEVDTDDVIANMKVAEVVPTKVSRSFSVVGESKERPLADVQAIKERGILRVGYRPSNVPFSYHNNAAELVGFDVELVSLLAQDLGVTIKFVPFRKKALAEGLNRGYFDLAVSGLAMNIDDMQQVIYSTPVMELNRSVVVPDYRVKEFDTLEKLREHDAFTLAYVEHDDAIKRIKPDYPNVTFKEIDNYKTFFKQEPGTYDSLLISAQAGSAWTLFFPNYGVAMITRETSYPVAYAVAQENPKLLRFIDNWLVLKKVGGAQKQIYDYWILGRGAREVGERWSVIRDVLGWVD